MRKSLVVLLTLVSLVGGIVVGRASANQPHMKNALEALNTARDQLTAADPNKGGHRERALSLVNQAIVEVKAGIDFARDK